MNEKLSAFGRYLRESGYTRPSPEEREAEAEALEERASNMRRRLLPERVEPVARLPLILADVNEPASSPLPRGRGRPDPADGGSFTGWAWGGMF